MAKHKLSSARRDQLRKELTRLSGKGKPAWSSLVALSKKYGITPESVRWHLKGVNPRAKRATAGSAKPAKRRKASKAAVKTGRMPALAEMADRYGEAGLKRALQASRLFPRWKKRLKKLGELHRSESRIRREIKVVTRQAGRLEKEIRRLTQV